MRLPCIDTFTPINRNAYLAARRAVDCTLTAAEQILEGYRLAYALIRPPGHHAERCAFGGFADERGEGAGRGYNVNVPLTENVDGEQYQKTLEKVLGRLVRFHPRFLIVALGLDTAKEDPTDTRSLEAKDFEAIGKMIGSLRFPTLVVQEGGYDTRVLGINARHFFDGLWSGAYTL